MERVITCPVCWDNNQCFEEVQETYSSYLCFHCGFMSDSRYEVDSLQLLDNLKKSPKLVQKLKVEDKEISEDSLKKYAPKILEGVEKILDFTKKVKNISEDEKKIIIEALWKIIYSDENADVYETNLMRRLSGLLYLDPKIVGDIKEKVSQKKS